MTHKLLLVVGFLTLFYLSVWACCAFLNWLGVIIANANRAADEEMEDATDTFRPSIYP